jgi:hypothetical protein
MSEMIQLPRSDWFEMKKAIAAFNEMVALNDLVNKHQAMEITGWNARTLSARVFDGTITVASQNAAGTKFYSRRQLMGLKK